MSLPRPFGRYTLIEKIANGGTAEIYRAQLVSGDGFRKTVAIKRLLPSWCESGELTRMLKDEARVLCHLPHQSIVQVYELGSEDGTPFLAMEYVRGIDCGRFINRLIRDRRPLPPHHALYIMEQVLTALEFAHHTEDDQGRPLLIVHRDISPSNILLSWNGEAKVTDFGIAKGLHRSERTDAGQIRGKYSYMSPEQARGESIDARTDIFACGIVLYEMLAARRLFGGPSDCGVLRRVADADFTLDGIEGLPAQVRALVMLAMAADVDGRYQSAADMRKDLMRAARALAEQSSSLDLAAYLRELFPEEISRERSATSFRAKGESTRVIDPPLFAAAPRRTGLAGYAWRVAAMVALLIATAAFAPIQGVVRAAEERPASGAESLEGIPRSQPPAAPRLKGMVSIESVPSGAGGTLVIGERREGIVTPFTLGDLEMGDGMEGRVELALDGFAPVVEEFRIGPESAAFVRSFPLERRADARLSISARPWGLATVPGYANRRETPIAALRVRPGSYLVRVTHPPSGQTLKRRVALANGGSVRCRATFGASPSISCR